MLFPCVPIMLMGMVKRSNAEVGVMVKSRMKTCGMTESRLRVAANVDRKTLMALLDGSRWPQEETRLRVETALGWAAGSIQDLREGKDATLIDERSAVLTDEGDSGQEWEYGPLADVPTATLAQIVSEGMEELKRRLTSNRSRRRLEPNPDAEPL